MSELLITFITKSFLFSAIFYLLYFLLLRKEKIFHFNRYYLLISALLSTLLPFINFNRFFTNNGITPSPELGIFDSLISTINTERITTQVQTFSVNVKSFDLLHFLNIIYFVVAAILIVKLVIGLIQVFHFLKRNPHSNKYGFTIVYLKENYAPFSFFRYVFVNEELTSRKGFAKIIEHEKTHVKQFHSMDILVVNLISSIAWINPFIWLILKELKAQHEYIADEKVIAQDFDSVSYSKLLLNQVAGVKAADFANCFSQPLIKKRILMMKKLKPGKWAYAKVLVVIPLALLLLAFSNLPNNTSNNKIEFTSSFQSQNGDEIPKGWFKGVFGPDEYEMRIDRDVTHDGKVSICIKSLKDDLEKFGNLMQTIAADEFIGKRIRFSGYIKTENAEPIGASLWMRVDRERKNPEDKNTSIAFDNMGNRCPKGTTDWQKFDIVLDVYQNAKYINYGMMLIKTGTAWFSGLSFEEVDSTVPVTDLKSHEGQPFPTKPVNLDFTE